jgi:hypothetical protein
VSPVARNFRRAALFLATAVLAGCPLSSDKPLSDPQAARVDPDLVGTWQTRDPETGESNRLVLYAFDEHQVVGVAPETDSDRVNAFRLFSTWIGTEGFLNIQELGSEDHGWYFASYRVDGDRMILKVVEDALFEGRKFPSSEQLQDFIRQHLSDARLYASSGEGESPEMVWERVNPPNPKP